MPPVTAPLQEVCGAQRQPVLSGQLLTKSFGANTALDGVSIQLHAGEVHAIAGENGSGKSTLLGCLSGNVRPDRGEILLDGEPVVWRSNRAAAQHGVRLVSQELTLVPQLSIADNVMLAHPPQTRSRVIPTARERLAAARYLGMVGLDEAPQRLVGSLPLHQQQMVEIARALSTNPRVLLLDEPTSSLERSEAARVITLARQLARQGIAVVFISHRMSELVEIADRLSVLRDGRLVARREPKESFDGRWVATAMVGRDIDLSRRAGTLLDPQPVLAASGLEDAGRKVRGVDLTLHRGEIVGLAGLVGAGRTELLETMYGSRRRRAGSVTLGANVIAASPASSMASGVCLVPDDRIGKALVPTMSVAENIGLHHERRRLAWNRRAERRSARMLAVEHQVVVADVTLPIRSLSGGNQQKTIFARYLSRSPKVLLLDEPTRGIDIAAKATIYDILRASASNGMAVLVASSELEELIQLCHRVLVMFEGRIVATLTGTQLTEDRIAQAATGMDAP